MKRRLELLDPLQFIMLGTFGSGQNQINVTPRTELYTSTDSNAPAKETQKYMGQHLSYGGIFRIELLTSAKGGLMFGVDAGFSKSFRTKPYTLNGSNVSQFTNDGIDTIFARISVGGRR